MTLTFTAVLWGFAEATLFFVVPDVLLTFIAVQDRRRALLACGGAVAGALAGGVLMYLWGSIDPRGALTVLDAVPAIGPAMIEEVRASLERAGATAIFLGPLTGTPYKIYAVMTGSMGTSLPLFLLVSLPARSLRFVALTLVTAWASRQHPFRRWSVTRKRLLLSVLWLVFYIGYLAAHWN